MRTFDSELETIADLRRRVGALEARLARTSAVRDATLVALSFDARTEHGNDASKNPEDYPVGLTTSPTVASAQGWPMTTGARGAVITVSTGAYTFQLLMSDNSTDGVQFRAGDGTTWGSWQSL